MRRGAPGVILAGLSVLAPAYQVSLSSINTSQGDEYGLHPSLAELATLYNTKKNAAVLTNVGSLVTPLTETDYLQQTKAIPLNLFSHLDQQTELQTSVAQGFATTGWGGRLADAMQGCNTTGFPPSYRWAGARFSRRAARPTRPRLPPHRFSACRASRPQRRPKHGWPRSKIY